TVRIRDAGGKQWRPRFVILWLRLRTRMPRIAMDPLDNLSETQEIERLADGFTFTEGPLWDAAGLYFFADVYASNLFRLVPGSRPELVRSDTGHGNGATFDLHRRLILCEGKNRRVTRCVPGGAVETLIEGYKGKRLNRPNDVVCRSNGDIYFTDPGLSVPLAERELPHSGVYCVSPDGSVRVVANCEYPNGLAFSP